MPGLPAGEPLGSIARQLAARLRAIGDDLPVAALHAVADDLGVAAAALYAVGTADPAVIKAAHELTGARMSVVAAARGMEQARARLDGYTHRALGICVPPVIAAMPVPATETKDDMP